MKTTEQLQNEYSQLALELANIEKLLANAEKAKERRRDLVGRWAEPGELAIKKQEIEDSRFPVYDDSQHIWCRRIVGVDNTWISLKYDGIRREVVRYKKHTGRRERRRNDNDAIDAEKALQIWREWQEEKAKESEPCAN